MQEGEGGAPVFFCEQEPRAGVRWLYPPSGQGSQGVSSRKRRSLGRFRHCQVSPSCFFPTYPFRSWSHRKGHFSSYRSA